MAIELISFGYVTGATVKVEFIRNSDQYRFDFTDHTFKNAGWGSRWLTPPEDATTTGWYFGNLDLSAVSPVADGSYTLLFTDSGIANTVIGSLAVDVVAQRFATGAGLAQAVAYQDLSVADQNTLAGTRLATLLMHIKRRFLGKVTQTATQQIVMQNDGATALATLPVADDGTTQTLGPAA